MLTLYNVVSADGFIADENGNEDFIPDGLWQDFLAQCKEKGALIVGRKAYEAIQAYDEPLRRALAELPIKRIVVSKNPQFAAEEGYVVAHSIEEAYALAPDALVSSGPNLNDQLIEKNLVGETILKKIPVLLGKGIMQSAHLDSNQGPTP